MLFEMNIGVLYMRSFLRIMIVCALGYGFVLAIDFRAYVKDQALMLRVHSQVFELLCPIETPGNVQKAVNFNGAKEYVLKFQH